MGIRRRRKKLTSLLSNLDRDIRSTTLRQVKRQTVVASDVTEEEETTNTSPTTPPPGSEIAVEPPDQWAKIIGGYYYPPTKTGGLGQVELFIGEDLQLFSLDKMYVSGTEVKWNQTSGGKTYTGSFRPNTANYTSTTTIRQVSQYGNPSWSTRAASTKPTYASIPSGVTNSILYTVTNKDYIPSRVTLSFRGTVASYYATTTTATITFTAAHHFVVGHIVDVSDLGSPMQDVDGIVKITAVPSSTQISYEFTKPLGSSISTTTPSTTSYVNAVVSKYTTIGSSWIDNSVVPNKVYIWNGLRWAGYTDALEDGLVTNDGIAPAPPTGLTLTSEGYIKDGLLAKESRSAVTLSWTGPTTNAEGGSLNDLAGYRIWYSTLSDSGPWIGKQNFGQETSQTLVDLMPGITHYFKVIAFDSYGLDSAGLDGSIMTTRIALSLEKPSAPTVTSRLGTITLTWDGTDFEGADAPPDLLAFVEVHYSTSSGFTPDATTLAAKIFGPKWLYVFGDLEYNTDYYFKIIAVDIHNRATDPSAQSTAKVTPLVDADLIAANLNSPLSVWPFAPKAVTAGALADGAIDASTVFGPDVVTQDAIAANAIGADQIASNAITAGKIEAGAVTTAKLDALAVTADKIAANTITAAKIATGTITATQISSSYVYAGTINADQINAGILTGFTIKTSNSTTRVELAGTSLTTYYDNVVTGTITGGTTGSNNGIRLAEPTGHSVWVTSDSVWLTTGGGVSGAYLYVSKNSGILMGGSSPIAMNAGVRITKGENISGNNSSTQGPLVVNDGSYYMKFDGNELSSYTSGGSGATLFLNGSGSDGAVTLGSGGGDVRAPNAYGRVYAGSIALRIGDNGTLATSTSSRRFKQNIEPMLFDIDSVLSMEPKQFKYIALVDEMGENDAPLSVGFIAEDAVDAGLNEFVHYDANGEVFAFDYANYVIALQAVARYQSSQIIQLSDRLSILESK